MAAAAILLAPILAGHGTAAAQGVVRSVYGDWQIRCDTPPGAQSEQCALMQSVTAEDRPNVGLTVIVLKTADQKSRLMRVVAPLGILLPSGLGLKIDNNDVGRAGFVKCLPNGCIAEITMDDTLINQIAQRPDLDLHHLPVARGRHRLPHEPERLWRRLRPPALIPVTPPPPAFPGAVQHDVVRRCAGIVTNCVSTTIPGPPRTAPLRSVLRCDGKRSRRCRMTACANASRLQPGRRD